MAQAVDLSDDVLQPVTILWSEKYACPIFQVNGKMYMNDTGEYAGYYDEVTDTAPRTDTPGTDLVSLDSADTTDAANPQRASGGSQGERDE